jgi:hypothetical protein
MGRGDQARRSKIRSETGLVLLCWAGLGSYLLCAGGYDCLAADILLQSHTEGREMGGHGNQLLPSAL